MPAPLKDLRLHPGTTAACQAGQLTIIKWRDHTRDVYMVSTKHGADVEDSGKTDRDGNPVLKPAAVLDYNKHKSGVDTSDQLASYHPFEHRTVKWYKKLFFRFLALVEVNSFLIYKKVTASQEPDLRRPLSHAQFTTQLVKDLVGGIEQLPPRKPRGRPMTQPAPERLVPVEHQHFPHHIPPTASKGHPARHCIVCKAVGKRKDSVFLCSQCQVCLCIVPCFQLYHAQRDFKAARRELLPATD